MDNRRKVKKKKKFRLMNNPIIQITKKKKTVSREYLDSVLTTEKTIFLDGGATDPASKTIFRRGENSRRMRGAYANDFTAFRLKGSSISSNFHIKCVGPNACKITWK